MKERSIIMIRCNDKIGHMGNNSNKSVNQNG